MPADMRKALAQGIIKLAPTAVNTIEEIMDHATKDDAPRLAAATKVIDMLQLHKPRELNVTHHVDSPANTQAFALALMGLASMFGNVPIDQEALAEAQSRIETSMKIAEKLPIPRGADAIIPSKKQRKPSPGLKEEVFKSYEDT